MFYSDKILQIIVTSNDVSLQKSMALAILDFDIATNFLKGTFFHLLYVATHENGSGFLTDIFKFPLTTYTVHVDGGYFQLPLIAH